MSGSITTNVRDMISLLRLRADSELSQRGFTFLTDHDGGRVFLSYAQLDAHARAIGARLQAAGLQGERALMLFPPGLDFITAFFGCLYGGVVAIPAFPPQEISEWQRIRGILQDSSAKAVLTIDAFVPMVAGAIDNLAGLHPVACIATDTVEVSALADNWRDPNVKPHHLAVLQYTSGSTGVPKGVMVSHGNLVDNQRQIGRAFGHDENSATVIWLPPYHDMGLVGGIMNPIYGGFQMTLMSPLTFIQRPLFWLEVMSELKATTSGGPNFAYELCARRITEEKLATLDLSNWVLAFCGGEPVRAATLDGFAKTFAPTGFRKEAFCPCYGLAESTLFVTGAHKEKPPVTAYVDKAALHRHRALVSSPGAESTALVGSGRVIDSHVVIVDPDTRRPRAAGEVGEIWVQGASVALGYWMRPEATQEAFGAYLANPDSSSKSGSSAESDSDLNTAFNNGPFFRTGDMGFFLGDELFVTGRLKDLIIIDGKTHYPHDIESTAEDAHPALRPGCGVAFSIEVEAEERLVILHEIKPAARKELDAIDVVRAIRAAVSKKHGISPHAVVLVEKSELPKTTSGKIRRRPSRDLYLQNALQVIAAETTERHATEVENTVAKIDEPAVLQ